MTDDGTMDTSKGVAVEGTQKSPSFGTQRGRSPAKKMLGPKQLIDENSSEGTDVYSEQMESQDLNDAESLAESLTSTSKVNVDVVNLCLHKVSSENRIAHVYLYKNLFSHKCGKIKTTFLLIGKGVSFEFSD